MFLVMKKILLLFAFFYAITLSAQSIAKLKFQNDTAVLNFENQTVTWKNSKKTNMILLLEDGFKNGYKWQEYEEDKFGNNNLVGTFNFSDKKFTKGYYIFERNKKKEIFKKL